MINIKTFTFNSFQVNTYLLFDDSKEAVIIDPACDSDAEFDELKNFIEDNELKLTRIANTHGHVDHVAGIEKVAGHYNIPFELHEADEFLVEAAPQSGAIFGFNIESVRKPDNNLIEGMPIKLGNSELKPIHVPGHSPGSIVFYSEENSFIIAGDVLFNGSIGRTDLPGGDYDTLISGIKNKLLTLPGETKVYCGHGPSTTIQQEHDTNPFLV